MLWLQFQKLADEKHQETKIDKIMELRVYPIKQNLTFYVEASDRVA